MRIRALLESVRLRWSTRNAAGAASAASRSSARPRTRLQRLIGSLLLLAFVVGCAEAVSGTWCEQDGVGLVVSAHWTEGPTSPDNPPASPSHGESHCHCSPLDGRTIAASDRPHPAVGPAAGVPVGQAERMPAGPEREPQLRPPATLPS